MSVLKAGASTVSPSWMSIARRVFPSRLELKRRAGSLSDAPLAKVSLTTLLYDSPVQRMPSCDQTGVPIHFHSSTTSGSASLMSLRILPRVFPRQSPSSAIRFEISSDAGWPRLAPGFFMFSSSLPVPGHRQRGEAAQVRHDAPDQLALRHREAQVGQAAEQGGEGDLALQAGERGAEAVVRAVTEREMALGTAPEVERLRALEVRRIAVRRAEDADQHVALLDRAPAEDGVLGGPA